MGFFFNMTIWLFSDVTNDNFYVQSQTRLLDLQPMTPPST